MVKITEKCVKKGKKESVLIVFCLFLIKNERGVN